MGRDALVITGPTASGKTAVAVRVAKALDGAIISMDSRQVYEGMDVGTAKAPTGERGGVEHYGFDVARPDERYSAGRFARDARRWIRRIRADGRVPMLVGGTGFFLRALTHPMFSEPPLDADRRSALHERLGALETRELARWREALEPAAALGDTSGGRQRLARAIEVALLTGRPLSWWHANAPPREPPIRPLVFVLGVDRDILFERIDARVDDMIEGGLVDEVRTLLGRGFAEDDPGMSATGYAELVPYVLGERTLDEAVALIKRATRRYARRQETWFRHQLPADTIRIETTVPADTQARTIVARWRAEEAN
jgi:tRNA dimethylallyltransferase